MYRKNLFKLIYNWFSYYIYWYLCLRGAKYGGENESFYYMGPIIGIFFIVIHILTQNERYREIKYVVICIIFGFCIETFYIYNGLIKYNSLYDSIGFLPPLWIIVLWAGFGTTVFHSFKWMIGRNILALFLGSIFFPLMYFLAGQYGSIILHGTKQNYLIISLVSSINFYVLILIAKQLYESK